MNSLTNVQSYKSSQQKKDTLTFQSISDPDQLSQLQARISELENELNKHQAVNSFAIKFPLFNNDSFFESESLH